MSMFDGSINVDGDADEDNDGVISKDELHRHFDEDGDGKVTPSEYDAHIDSRHRKGRWKRNV